MVSDLLCAIAGFFSGGLLSYLIFGRNRISLKKFEEASDQMKAEKELFEISSEKQLRNLNESIEALQKNLIAEIEKRSKYECENQFLKESIEENQKKNEHPHCR